MTRTEAIAEMKKGNKVTHIFFSDNEWMTMEGEKIEESKFVELRKEFYKETRTFAMTNKKGYTKWLEAKLVKKLTIPNVSQQRELLLSELVEWLVINTNLDMEKVADFEERFKQ